MTEKQGIRGEMARLYNVFVDWKGRLGREMPGLTSRLESAGVKRILDVGCGTGRHVAALNEAGFEAYGADVSEEMLQQARELGGERFFLWRLGDPAPGDLPVPYDAIVCLGNTWPQIRDDDDIERAVATLRGLLRPGGVLIVGLKALAVRRDSGNPYLPLLRREHEGHPLFFIRFAEFADDSPLAEFHMVIVRGGAEMGKEAECLQHGVHLVRVWSPAELVEAFSGAGFRDVKVSASIGDPDVPAKTEDVFVHAVA